MEREVDQQPGAERHQAAPSSSVNPTGTEIATGLVARERAAPGYHLRLVDRTSSLPGLTGVRIRRLERADIPAATTVIREGGWGERQTVLDFYVDQPRIYPLLAEADGQIIGTAVATKNGSVGWVGLVFVTPAWRGHGLGRELTRATVDVLHDSGCRTVLLAASGLGKPVYDRLGFVDDGDYVELTGPTLAVPPAADPVIRPLRSADLAAVSALDRLASGEDRAHLISPDASGWIAERQGAVHGYALWARPWSFGPTIADNAADGALLLDLLRARARGPEVGILVPTANTAAVDHLTAAGFVASRRLPRMWLGERVAWQPTHIWSLFSFAVG
jgi:predicted N-acetyltransferase YhbS